MMKLDNFINMMTGHFNNKEQFDNMQREGKTYPYAEHINTICNEKILNLPKDFNGKFVVEESYYETNGKRHASPHLFLITEKEDGIVLYSYEIPEGEDKSTFSYDSMKNADYTELKKSEKFTPALYHEKDGIWEGGSTSRFSPVMTFKLLDMMNQLSISEYNPRMKCCDKFQIYGGIYYESNHFNHSNGNCSVGRFFLWCWNERSNGWSNTTFNDYRFCLHY